MSIAINNRIDLAEMRLSALEIEAKRVAKELDRLAVEKALEKTDPKKVHNGRTTA